METHGYTVYTPADIKDATGNLAFLFTIEQMPHYGKPHRSSDKKPLLTGGSENRGVIRSY